MARMRPFPSIFPPSLLLLLLLLLTALSIAKENEELDLTLRLASPSPLRKRSAALVRRMELRCDMGYATCPGGGYCCQDGLTCFSDGTCGSIDMMSCWTGETKCGQGTGAGCCPVGSKCVDDVKGKCVVSSHASSWRERTGMGVGTAVAVVVGVGGLVGRL